jgi:hypothetical protein
MCAGAVRAHRTLRRPAHSGQFAHQAISGARAESLEPCDGQPSDAGVASALVNTGQQVRGAVGTAALLNTIAATVTASYLAARSPSPANTAAAAVAGDTRAFLLSAGIFLVAAGVSAVILPSGPNPVALNPALPT